MAQEQQGSPTSHQSSGIPRHHQDRPVSPDAEKHERPDSGPGPSSSGGTSSSRTQAPEPDLARSASGTSLSRTISEPRDEFPTRVDLERGPDEDAVEKEPTREPPDPDLVQWDGPDDPQNPRVWPLKKKWAAVISISFFSLISPIASTMVAPGLTTIGAELGINSPLPQAVMLSIFVAAYALGPLLWGPLSELYGRVIVIQVSNLWFLLFNLGCGFAQTGGQMIAFRFLGGIGGSAPLAVGGGVLSDTFAPEQRGRAMSLYAVTPLIGPAIGPIAGGWIAESADWRWVFWSTTIASVVVQAAGLVFLRETYAPVLLGRKRARLAKQTGNTKLRTEFDRPDRTLAQTLGVALTRPFRLMATQVIVQLLALYMMYLYGMMYIVLASFPTLWADKYHETPGILGLNYISLGLGFFVGCQACAPLQDRIYAALKRRLTPAGAGPGRPEFRVPIMLPGAVLVPAGLLAYSWAAEAGAHWIWPNVGAAVYAAGTVVTFLCLQSYLVDAYARYAASAVGAATVLRSLAGFGFPLFAPAMYDRLGYGVGGSVLAAVAVAIGVPSPFLLWRYGERLRARSKFTA